MADRRLVALLGGVLLASALVPGSSAQADPGSSEAFRGGSAYTGKFPDPTVLRVGSTFYAYATTVAALNLPVTTSSDLRTWTARPSDDPDRPFENDADRKSVV